MGFQLCALDYLRNMSILGFSCLQGGIHASQIRRLTTDKECGWGKYPYLPHPTGGLGVGWWGRCDNGFYNFDDIYGGKGFRG